MPKFIIFVILTQLFWNMGLVVQGNADTIELSSCLQEEVESAIFTAKEGDTVRLPAQVCSWSSRIVIDKQITVAGATTTTRNDSTYEVSVTDGTRIRINGFELTETDNVRITGITFDHISNNIFNFSSGISNIRIDHCHFDGCGRLWTKNDSVTGLLFDHNRITEPSQESIYITGDGNAAWLAGGACGSENPGNTTWIEGNEFVWTATGGGANPVDSGEGARFVLRHNRFTGHADRSWGELIEAHGHCWGQRDGNDNAGAYCTEISNNKLYKARDDYGLLLKSRGGKSYVYNNELYDAGWSANATIRFWTQEVNTPCNNSPCTSQAHADMGLHPVPAVGWNCAEYPCPMQVNNSYLWDNARDSGTIAVDPDWGAEGYVVEDRDYWDDLGPGDTNFTSGLSADRAQTCTAEDSYWEADTGRLYRCTTTDTWRMIYQAFTYPHPLQGGGEQNTPAAPTGLYIVQPQS